MNYLSKNSLIIMALMASSFGITQAAHRRRLCGPLEYKIRADWVKNRARRVAQKAQSEKSLYKKLTCLAVQLDTPPSSPSLSQRKDLSLNTSTSSPLSASSSSSTASPLLSSPVQLISPFTASLGMPLRWRTSVVSVAGGASA